MEAVVVFLFFFFFFFLSELLHGWSSLQCLSSGMTSVQTNGSVRAERVNRGLSDESPHLLQPLHREIYNNSL